MVFIFFIREGKFLSAYILARRDKITTYIALLRGINVGAHHRIKMQDLKKLLTSMGLENVTTYIQSGNVIFQSSEVKEVLQIKMEKDIHKAFGFSTPVILRTDQEFKEIISSCPYADGEVFT